MLQCSRWRVGFGTGVIYDRLKRARSGARSYSTAWEVAFEPYQTHRLAGGHPRGGEAGDVACGVVASHCFRTDTNSQGLPVYTCIFLDTAVLFSS